LPGKALLLRIEETPRLKIRARMVPIVKQQNCSSPWIRPIGHISFQVKKMARGSTIVIDAKI
jgi:hypothetical protein